MHIVVFANGEPPTKSTIEEFSQGADLIIAADGGANNALSVDLIPNFIIGDMDSITDSTRSSIEKTRILIDKNPEKTDLEKTIEACLSKGATLIDVLCAGGGRADHALANLSILTRFGREARIRIIDDFFEIELVNYKLHLKEPLGTVISLVALGRCLGITTSGLRWNLNEATFEFSTQGIHNEIVDNLAKIQVETGDLLLFKGRWIEKHS
jgi:thiamine pyrophosphokinase|tara:strand:- start:711 stop:1343 length:633 start_codon:yes stop_codon:yes gene_type:complete